MSRHSAISYEPCTLVYTLIDPKVINFEDMSLIVRSLHSFMVESVTPNPSQNNVHVKLNYQASVANAQNKLGSLQCAVAVTKLSNFVQESEFSRLEQLKRKYGIGQQDDAVCPPPSVNPPRGNRGRGRGRVPKFAPRPSPYKKAPEIPSPEECDYVYNNPSHQDYAISGEEGTSSVLHYYSTQENEQQVDE